MALELNEISELLDSARSGNRRSLSRLMTEIADSPNIPMFQSESSWILGVTGPPGAGKSTLIGQMVRHWVAAGENVAVLALDPTSPISGGSFLADRIRMEGDDLGDNVFVRSIASGKSPGGISPRIWPMCRALSDCGDIIQAEKAGILELADVIAVNKSDLPGAASSAQSIKTSLGLVDDDNREVLLVSALEGTGIEDLITTIESCEPQVERNQMMMRERLISEWESLLVSHPEIDEILAKLCTDSITVSEAIQILSSSTGQSG